MVKYYTMEKIWQTAETVKKEIEDKFPEINPIVLQLLVNRKIDTQDKIDRFLTPDYGTDLYDPFLFADMEKAVLRILQAVESKEKIIVYGDYDADGVTSSAVMMETLKAFEADVDIYIPFRETEGYGLNKKAIDSIIESGTKLIITVDCGISNKNEVKQAMDKGVDVIITDHHHGPEELPPSFATINPNVKTEKYPFKGLTGCGVAFKVVQALLARQKDFKVKQLPEGFEKWLLDLVAIGTIADIQPLLSENRVFVKYGLLVFNKTKRLGLLELFKSLGNRTNVIDEKVIGWQVAPRINAAGRLNHASTSYELLITKDKKEALDLTKELTDTNQERQKISENIRNQALKIIGQVKDQKILIAAGHSWPTGIVGLVAGRIADMFHRPTLIISHFNGEIIGSARSIAEFNVIEAISKCSDCLVKFGGHPQAAGFTIKDEKALEEFVKKMTALAEQELQGKNISPILEIEAEIDLENVNWSLFEDLEKFEPFGDCNPKPRFVSKNLTVVEHQKVGKDETHMRLMVSHKTPTVRKTIGFSLGSWCDKLEKGDKVDIVYEIDVNEWNGNRELQLRLIDIKKSDD